MHQQFGFTIIGDWYDLPDCDGPCIRVAKQLEAQAQKGIETEPYWGPRLKDATEKNDEKKDE